MRWRKEPDLPNPRWIIVKTTGKNGIHLAYFKWSAHKTWDWTKDLRKAQRFSTQQLAERSIMSTSADWQAKWETIQLST